MKKKIIAMSLLGTLLAACGSTTKTTSNSSANTSDIVSTNSEVTTSSESTSSEELSSELNTSSSSSENDTVTSVTTVGEFCKVVVINGTCSSSDVEKGSTVTVTADEPKNGYAFIGFEDENGTIVSKELTYEFVVESDVTLTAIYRIRDIEVTIINGQGSGTYALGEEISVTSNIAEEDYVFEGWKNQDGVIVSTQSNYTFIVNESITLTASYILKDVTLTVYQGSGSGTYSYGTKVTLVADNPESGKEFTCWMKDDGTVLSREKTFTLTVDDDIVVSAIFSTIFYDVNVTNGYTTLSTAFYNQEVTVSADELQGQIFKGWQDSNGNIVSTSNPYTFKVSSDITLTAIYESISISSFASPTNIDELIESVAMASIVQNQTNHINYYFDDNSSSKTTLDITSYSNGLYATGEGPTSSYSSAYPLTHIVKLENNKLAEVKKFGGSALSSYSYAKKYDITSNVEDENTQIRSSKAQEFFGCYNMISDIYSLINNFKDTGATFNVNQINNDQFEVILNKAVDESNTMYGVSYLKLTFNAPDFYISSVDYDRKVYVKATQMENGILKDNATPRDTYKTTYACTRGEKQTLPSEQDITPYFISNFDFKGTYYENNVSRNFDRINNKIAKDVTIDISRITMDANSVTPSTAIESKTLKFVSSSNESVIALAPNSKTQLRTLSYGISTLVFSSSSGVEVSMDVEVCDLAPTALTINSLDKVNVNEKIELSIETRPISASQNVIWSVSDSSIATIEYSDNKVYLKGLSRGYVVVKATSQDDETVIAEKSVYVSNGNLNETEIKSLITGTWYKEMSSYSKQGFTFIFDEDGNLIINDNYRGASARISCEARWKISSKNDSEFLHNGSNVISLEDYYLIEVTNVDMTDSPAYWMEIHFMIAKDGSSFIYHFMPGSKSASTMSGQMTKIA